MRTYRWGTIQGIFLIGMGLAGLLIGGVLHDSALPLNIAFIGTGLCLFWKMTGGVAGLIYLCCSLIWHMIFDRGHPGFSLVVLIFLATPTIFYYPKRWRDLTWSGRKEKVVSPQQQQSHSPDFGKHLAATGMGQNTKFIYPTLEMRSLQVVGLGRYCSTLVQPHEGQLYCATFDFDDDALCEILKAATPRTLDLVTASLIEDPESVRDITLPDALNIGAAVVLGELQQGLHDLFIPLVITEVFGV